MYKKYIGNILKLVCQGTEKGNMAYNLSFLSDFFKKIDLLKFWSACTEAYRNLFIQKKLKNKNKKRTGRRVSIKEQKL